MSGFAVLNGEPDGAPLLPPLALADGVAALATAFAIMVALRAREQTGRGQVVDTSLVEPLLTLLGPQLTAFDLLGELQPRTGNRSSHNAPRNLYRTADGSWVAVSSSATSIAERVHASSSAGRTSPPSRGSRPAPGAPSTWTRSTTPSRPGSASAPRDEVLAAFETAGCAIAPVYDARDVLADPQLEALGSISTVDDLQLGPLRMPNVISRLSETPGRIRHAGGRHGADTAAVFAELGVKADELAHAPRRPRRMTVPPLTWLYVPADRPDRVEKAIASRAHAVIVDLEDGVAPGAKEAARASLAGAPRRARATSRSTSASTPARRRRPGGGRRARAERDPRAEGRPVPRTCPSTDRTGPLPDRVGGRARGRVRDRERPRGVAGISLGEADLRSETGALEAGLDWARGRIVNAAVAAGLPRPPQSVYPHVRDAEGLARSCARGRELGHLGRAAIHPDQLPVIEQAYLPTDDEVERARATVERLEAAGAGTLDGGEFVDAAMLGAARQIVALAESYGTA